MRGDPEDERPERLAADHVGPQGGHDSEADLLGHIIGRPEHGVLVPQAAAAVAQGQGVNLREQLISGRDAARNGGPD